MKALAKLLRKAAEKLDPTIERSVHFQAPRLSADDIFGSIGEPEPVDHILLHGEKLENQVEKRGRYAGYEAFIAVREGYDESVDAVACTVYEPIAPGEFREHFATANQDGIFLHGVPFFNVNPEPLRRFDYPSRQIREAFLTPRPHEITPDLEGWMANGEEL